MRYPIPDLARAPWHEESLEVQKSRFTARVAHAATPEQAQQLIDQARLDHPDASHHCSAFIAGPPGEQNAIGFSDDGEPGGTAGRPMYQVLEGSGLGQISAVIIRYFGGTKLGTGGLVRAYSKSLLQALETLPTQEYVTRRALWLTTDFALEHELRRWAELNEAPIDQALHDAEGVTLGLAWPMDRTPDIEGLHSRLKGRLVCHDDPPAPA
ncbi:IMPACT family protein [Kushneria indalinina]|uniref:Putative YigZ family protein n=1 Tax=Kushneria indalinina DSM 14324 TaxID=1122140 RepID=A0A3D9DXZ9_9GAMM|nr:YigZ family protein [Kushneria indalinina]REC95535.1 putative YigZ family protein [Kushneria indalinina DSM 14324]